MNKVQDSCTGPRIPRLFGTLSGSCLIVPKNLGILGNLGPVHESCTLFIRNLGNLGPGNRLVTSMMGKAHQTFPKIPSLNKVHETCTGPRFPRIPRFWGTIRQDPDKVPKNIGILGILGLCMNPALCSSGILGILGLCRFPAVIINQIFCFNISTEVNVDTSEI